MQSLNSSISHVLPLNEVITAFASKNSVISMAQQVQPVKCQSLLPVPEFSIDGVIFPLDSKLISLLTTFLQKSILFWNCSNAEQTSSNQWLSSEISWRTIAILDALLPGSLSVNGSDVDGSVDSLISILLKFNFTVSNTDMFNLTFNSDRLRNKLWEV